MKRKWLIFKIAILKFLLHAPYLTYPMGFIWAGWGYIKLRIKAYRISKEVHISYEDALKWAVSEEKRTLKNSIKKRTDNIHKMQEST